jgi:pilus assembly protein CpaB
MMRNRVGVILVLALVSGLLAAYLAFRFLRQDTVPGVVQAAEAPTVQVVVAARDMNFGELITDQDLRVIDWPASSLPEGFASSPEDVVGRGLITPVRLNEPFLSSKIASSEAGAGVPLGIEEGMRAMAVRVNDVIGVAGFIMPHQRVDVLVTLDQGAQITEPITQVVLQDIEVLGIGQMTAVNDENQAVQVPVVTLIVSPNDAERLTLAETKGQIRLALRNSLDRDTVETQGIRTRELIAGRRAAPTGPRRVVPRQPTSVSVEVFRGTQETTEEVPPGGGGGGS